MIVARSKIVAKRSLVSICLLLVLNAAGVAAEPEDRATARLLIDAAVGRLEWMNFWLPHTVPDLYVPAVPVDLEVLLWKEGGGFCASEFGGCQVFLLADGKYLPVRTFAMREGLAAETAFAEQMDALRASRVPSASGRTILSDTLDRPSAGARGPTPRSIPNALEAFRSHRVHFELPTLETPEEIAHQTRPTDTRLKLLKEALAEAVLDTGCGSAYRAHIPFHSRASAQYVPIHVELEGECGDAIFSFYLSYPDYVELGFMSFDERLLQTWIPKIASSRLEKLEMPER